MPRFRFVCEECGADALVDGAIREDALADGCPLCGRPVDPAAFRPADADPHP
ncbi:MAG: hypothetical protein ABEJ42_06695 [Halobacteriaceae archaeon]